MCFTIPHRSCLSLSLSSSSYFPQIISFPHKLPSDSIEIVLTEKNKPKMCTANPAFPCDDLARTDLSNDGSRLKPVRLRERSLTKVVAPGTGRDVEREPNLLVRNRLGISIGWEEASSGLLFLFMRRPHGPGRVPHGWMSDGWMSHPRAFVTIDFALCVLTYCVHHQNMNFRYSNLICFVIQSPPSST